MYIKIENNRQVLSEKLPSHLQGEPPSVYNLAGFYEIKKSTYNPNIQKLGALYIDYNLKIAFYKVVNRFCGWLCMR